MNKEKLETKIAKHPLEKDVGVSEPRARVKALTERASAIEMDRNIRPQRYIVLLLHYGISVLCSAKNLFSLFTASLRNYDFDLCILGIIVLV